MVRLDDHDCILGPWLVREILANARPMEPKGAIGHPPVPPPYAIHSAIFDLRSSPRRIARSFIIAKSTGVMIRT